jgi:cell filamentation protein
MTDDPYLYPGTLILRNKLGIKDADDFEKAERLIVTERQAEGVPTGDFDLAHLQAIHRHLFQNWYDWAGEIRTFEIKKGGQQFMFRQYIENGMADVHRRITAANYFKGTSVEAFADEAGRIMGDVNYVHPFREGNGRTQLLYLEQLSATAGYLLTLRHIDGDAWIEASRLAHDTDYTLMSRTIHTALERSAAPPEPAPASDQLQQDLRAAEKDTKSDDPPGKATDRGKDRGR